MKRIALDLDGVVYNYSATACYLLNHYKGYKLDWEQTDSWDWLKDQVKKEDWAWLWSGGIKEGLFRYGHLVKGAAEGIKQLVKLGKIAAVTSRPDTAVKDTLKWLAYMEFPIGEVHITQGNKADLKPDLAIDDGPHNVQDYVNAGIPCILYVRRYNEHMIGKSPLIHPAFDWNDVVRLTGELTRG
jgi:5'(3')-deoxyribonucleotidase